MATTTDEDVFAGIPNDEMPDGVNVEVEDGKVPCPICQKGFKPSGLNRHITVTHGEGQKPRGSSSTTTGNRRSVSISDTGKKFQQSISLLVAMACKDCATVLFNDAESDWKAIDEFCQSRPKLRKQVQDMLSLSDFMLLVGALGGTAQRMAAHHSIGKRLPFGYQQGSDDNDHESHDKMQQMAQWMQAMDPSARSDLIDNALKAYTSNGQSIGADS